MQYLLTVGNDDPTEIACATKAKGIDRADRVYAENESRLDVTLTTKAGLVIHERLGFTPKEPKVRAPRAPRGPRVYVARPNLRPLKPGIRHGIPSTYAAGCRCVDEITQPDGSTIHGCQEAWSLDSAFHRARRAAEAAGEPIPARPLCCPPERVRVAPTETGVTRSVKAAKAAERVEALMDRLHPAKVKVSA